MNKKIIIWGAARLGRYAIKELQKEGYDIVSVVDNNESLQGQKIEGIPVVSFENMQKKPAEEGVYLLLAVTSSKNVFEVLEQAEGAGYENIGILKPRAERYRLEISPEKEETESEVIWYIKNGKKEQVVPRVELNLIDNCNLNCKGCTHFSSLYKDMSVLPFTQFKSELNQLRKIGKFVRIRLLGGEPFLIPELGNYIRFARELFKEADIEVVTNGLLIHKLEKALLREIKDCAVSVVISPYKPTLAAAEIMGKVLDRYHIRWCFDGQMVTEFSRQLTLESGHDGEKASRKCVSSGCLFLRNGKIYKCPIAGLINDFLSYYSRNPVPDTGVSIWGDRQEVYQYISMCARQASIICNYCSEDVEMIPWSISAQPCLDDWLYHAGCHETTARGD